jgi:hypothetical protein
MMSRIFSNKSESLLFQYCIIPYHTITTISCLTK